jgi:nucleoside 2-deoxyribosyltransferase
VFSPYHDIGIGDPHQVVPKDIVEIKKTDLLFAIMNGLDPGTLFEIGYAKALGKRVVVLAENIGINDLTMLIGTDCEITADFATAIYKASW